VVTLAEDLLLLASDETSGRARIPLIRLELGLGGARLLDLVLRDRIRLVDGHVSIAVPGAVDEPLLDDALAIIAAEARPREPVHWVRRLAKGARQVVQERLITAGVLRLEEHKLLGLIPVRHMQEIDTRIEHDLMLRLNQVVVLGHPASRETTAMVSLVLALGLERQLFPRSDQRAVRHRMHEIAEGEWVGEAIRHAVDAADTTLGVGPGSWVATED
jgi:Golgi phosphoprotein 3 (GPP34)